MKAEYCVTGDAAVEIALSCSRCRLGLLALLFLLGQPPLLFLSGLRLDEFTVEGYVFRGNPSLALLYIYLHPAFCLLHDQQIRSLGHHTGNKLEDVTEDKSSLPIQSIIESIPLANSDAAQAEPVYLLSESKLKLCIRGEILPIVTSLSLIYYRFITSVTKYITLS